MFSSENFAEVSIYQMMGKFRRRIQQGTPFTQMLDDLYATLEMLLPYDRLGIALIEDDDSVHLTWMKSRMPTNHLVTGFNAKLRGSSLERLLKQKRPRIINNLCDYLVANPGSWATRAAIKDGILSNLTAVLQVNDKPIGFMFFSSREINTYKDAHVALFETVAEEIAFIVEYGRLQRFFEESKSSESFFRHALHDLKTPIATIQGFIELIQKQSWFGELDNTEMKFFDILKKNAIQMHSLVSDLGEFRQLKNPLQQIDSKEILLDDFLDELEASFKLLSSKKEINFELVRYDLPLTWTLDEGKIRQVLNNLLSNALKFSHRLTSIELKVRCEKDWLIFEMKDHGLGIPQDEIQQLFTEFGKTSAKPTEGETSSGLGLAIVKAIVDSHGGEVGVKSEVGHGSTFSFRLPHSLPSEPLR